MNIIKTEEPCASTSTTKTIDIKDNIIKLEKIKEDINEESDIKDDKVKQLKTADELPLKIDFICAYCKLTEKCDYLGKHPVFCKTINFCEDSYVMKDPFSPPPGQHTSKSNTEYFLILGANCSICKQMVCQSSECSIFYARTFCQKCALKTIKEFPIEIQSKIRKIFMK